MQLMEIRFPECPIPESRYRQAEPDGPPGFGHIWRILVNDADPFPSNPHAHNLESGLKLDLGDGRLYFARKDTGHAISGPHLFFIRRQLTQKGIRLPAFK
jgi:hypothetical protein